MKEKTLLIVDDEISLLSSLKLIMENEVDRILTAISAPQAFEIIEKNRVDVIVTDITMPVINGVEMLKTLRQKGHRMPVIFFSGYGSHEFMSEALELGAYEFLEKPRVTHLPEVVSRALKNPEQTAFKISSKNPDFERLIQKKREAKGFSFKDSSDAGISSADDRD